MLDFGIVLNAILLVLGVVWCKEILGRWRSDWARFRESDEREERVAILFYWVVTAVIIYLMINFVIGIFRVF